MTEILNASFFTLTLMTIIGSWMICYKLRCKDSHINILYRFGGAAVLLGLMTDALARLAHLTGNESLLSMYLEIPDELAFTAVQLGVGIVILGWALGANLQVHHNHNNKN